MSRVAIAVRFPAAIALVVGGCWTGHWYEVCTSRTPMRIVHTERTAATDAIDYWFTVLDGQRIDVGGTTWVIEVLGIHPDGADLWVQVAPQGRASSSLVLRVSGETRAESVQSILCSRGGNWPATGVQVIDVRPTRPAA